MNTLTLRQVKFINLLLEETNYRPIKYYSEILDVSEKTLKNDLLIIKEYLNLFNIQLHKKHSLGIVIKDAWRAKLLIKTNLNMQKDKDANISINHRRIDIMKNMLMNANSKTSVQKLSDKYYVSKSSILNDFKYIEDWLSTFNLSFEKTISGTQIIGEEINIRKAISCLLFEYCYDTKNNKTFEALVNRLDAITLNGLSELFEEDKIIYVVELLLNLEEKYDCRIDDPYYINLITHILISMVRGTKGKPNFSKEKINNLKSKKEYKEAVSCIEKINKDFNMNLDEAEVYYLYKYFVSFGLIKELPEQDSLDTLNLTAIIFRDSITKHLDEILQVNIKSNKDVMDKLLIHIRAMLNRIEYDISITNPLISDIRAQYPILLSLCRVATLITSYELNQKDIPIDEIAYLALYYQLGLESYTTKKQALIVCHSGYGTSSLLTTRINKYFPNLEIVDTLSSNKIITRDLSDIDLVISTVSLDLKDKPQILVSVFLSEKDIENISNYLINIKSRKKSRFITTPYIGDYIFEDLIYFNKQNDEIKESILKNLKDPINFNEVQVNKNLIINISFSDKHNKLGLCINDIENSEKQLVYYLIMNDTRLMSQVLKEIVSFNIHENYGEYLRKCKVPKDVKIYFQLNSKGEKEVELDLSKVICKETIKLDMKAKNKNEALKELTELLYDADVISNKEAFLEDVYYRETLGSTGIGNGIAIPHGKSKFVSRTSIAFGKTKENLEWETLDGEPVNFIILFAVTESDKTSTHVRLLSKIATKLGDDEACAALLKATTPEEVYEIFTKQDDVI